MLKNSYRYLKPIYWDYVILILSGSFYHAFEDSAYVLNNCFGYIIYDNTHNQHQAGFPVFALDKVTKRFEYLQINYIVVENYEIVIEKSFQHNHFNSFNNSIYLHNYKENNELNKNNADINKVSYGDIVKLLFEDSGEIQEYSIFPLKKEVKYTGCGGAYDGSNTELVIAENLDITQNQISDESPIGNALLGSSVGDCLKINLPYDNLLKIKILEIHKQKKHIT